jgi:hypothetical protein
MKFYTTSLIILSLGILKSDSVFANDYAFAYEKEFPINHVTQLKVDIQIGAAEMGIASHRGEPLVKILIHYDKETTPNIEFSENGKNGKLLIENNGSGGKGFTVFGNTDLELWEISLSRELEIDLNVEFGLGAGHADFGGMNLSELAFATGLSDVELLFSEPCRGTVESVAFFTGLGSMEVRGLSNIQFEKLEFAGGLGSALLNFDGDIRKSSLIDLDVGMGSLVLEIPENYGVKIRHNDSFLANHEFDRLERVSEDTWYSEKWREGEGNLSFALSIGMGSAELVWVNEFEDEPNH